MKKTVKNGNVVRRQGNEYVRQGRITITEDENKRQMAVIDIKGDVFTAILNDPIDLKDYREYLAAKKAAKI